MRDGNAALTRAIKAAGGLKGLASALGVTKQAVSLWKEVPPLRVLGVERASGVSRTELRPDLYPPDDTTGNGTISPTPTPDSCCSS